MAGVIKHNEIIEEGVFDNAIRGAELLITKLEEAKTVFQGVANEMLTKMKGMNITTPEGKQGVVSNSADVERLKSEVTRLNSEISKLTSNYEKLKKASGDYNKQSNKMSQMDKDWVSNINKRLTTEKSLRDKNYKDEIRAINEKNKQVQRDLNKHYAEVDRQRKNDLRKNEKDLQDALKKQKKINDDKIADNKRMLNSFSKVMLEYQAEQKKGDRTSMLSGAKKVASTAEYKQMLMYSKLVKAENNALDGTVEKLKASYARVVFELKNFHQIGSAAYNKLQEEAKEYNNQLKKSEQAHGVFGRSVGNYVTAIRNAWFGLTTALAGTLYTLKRWIMLNADLSDSMAAVRRTTGMTQDEVYALNETLRGFNTRTAQASLLDLAHVAGKLGIAKNDIAGFVKAADMIGVALGKDLGNNEEAINQLGRIVTIFKLSEGVGFEKALLKVGSALKDLGNASVAEEVNVIDFTKRLAGLGNAAGLTVDKIMALGATYDILGQTMEVSSTATSQIWIAMAQKTEMFARIAGMSVKDFSDLMKRDFNEAFIAFVKGLSKGQGGILELAKYFEGLGLDGRRIIGVMTVLSDKISIYREQMKISKDSLDAGTTAAEQFAIQNETLAASIDKATKAFKNFFANSAILSGMKREVDLLTLSWLKYRAVLDMITGNVNLGLDIGKTPEELKVKQIAASQAKNETLRKKLETEIALTKKAIEIEALRAKNQKAFDDYANSKIGLGDVNDDGTKKTKAQIKLEKELERLQKQQQSERMKLENEYYEFQRNLGFLTIEDIIEHEKQKLTDQGVWAKASEKERSEFIKQARIKAEEEVNEKALKGSISHYDDLIAEAKRNNEETYPIEREKYTFLMSKYKEDTSKYREYKQALLNLDDEFADKALKRQEQLFKDIQDLENENMRLSFQNRLDENTNQQNAIKNKKEKGGRGISPTMLSDSDVSELQGLVEERNSILKAQADFEIGLNNKLIASYSELAAIMSGWGDETRAKKFNLMAENLSQKNIGISEGLDANIAANNESGSDASMGLTPIAKFFGSPKKWQNDLNSIVNEVQKFADQVNSILSSISQQYQQQQEVELAAVESRYQAEYDALDRAVTNKTMSEQAAADKKAALEKKQKAESEKLNKEYAKKQQQVAIIQAIINTALGVTQALGGSPPPLNFILAALVGIAGGVEIGTISSQQFAEGGHGEIDKKKGGVLSGKRHSQGGIKLPGIGEAEGGEYFAIINRDATRRYANQLPLLFDSINNQRYEQMFSRRGINMNVNVNDRYGKEMLSEMKRKKTETRTYQEGNFMVYETGNYRLKTSVQ